MKDLEVKQDPISKLRLKTKFTHPNKKIDISIVGPGAIICDKEVLYQKRSTFDAIVCEDGSVFYEINGEAFSNLIKYNKSFFNNFIKKTNARENFRLNRKKTAIDDYHLVQYDKRSTKMMVED